MSDIIDHGQKQMDLTPWLGGNVLPTGGETPEQDPFCGEVPNDRQGYSQYKTFYERKMQEMMGQQGTMSQHMNCEVWDERGNPLKLNRQIDEHRGAGVIISCSHVIYQDPVNPEGVYFYPYSRGSSNGYYVCKSCFNLAERRRLNMGTQLHMKCSMCVLESIERIAVKFPDRLVNLISK